MTPQEQNIAIAEACGKLTKEDWDFIKEQSGVDWWLENGKFCFRNGGKVDSCHRIPDYLNDLNAMHEAEKVLDNIWLACYCEILLKHRHYTGWSDNWIAIHATAAQRAKAFLRTLGKWKE